jgi:hypothetical protein
MYRLTKEKKVIENEEQTVYGIQCGEYGVSDVSASREETERLIELFNQNNLSPCQLYETVCDIIDS